MSYVVKLCSRNQTSPFAVTRTTITTLVDTGFSFVEKLDDSLDIGTMVIRPTTSSEPYDMFNWIEVYDDTTLLYSMRIGGDNVKLLSKNPLRYEHTLTLVEHTKILERFLISGKTFTQPTTPTIRYYLYDVIEDLINTTPLETSNNLSTTRLITLPSSGALYTLLTTTVSPEFTFNEVTFREGLTQVGGYIDGIPRLVINSSDELELTFDFVNELEDLIASETPFISKSVSQNIDLYATQIESQALNLVNDESIAESVEIYPIKDGWITARSDQYIFDFLKSYIPTYKPIYSIEKLLARINMTIDDGGPTGTGLITYVNGEYEFDMAVRDANGDKRVVEFEKYKTLETSTTNVATPTYYYKNNVIYYKDRQPNVFHNDTYGIEGVGITLENVIILTAYEQMITDGLITGSEPFSDFRFVINDSYNDYKYQVHYVPVPRSTRLNIDRGDLSDVKYDSALLSNQQLRLVNLEHFVNNLQGRINRIGNSELQLENRVISHTNLYSIGDYTSDMYIITEKEVIFYKKYIYAKYGLSKNYNMISRFIGVNSEIRQWDMGEKNLLDRNLIYKEYIEVETVNIGSGSDTSQLFQSDGIASFLNTLNPNSTLEPVRGGMIVGDDIPSTTLVPLSSNGGGNSLIFNFKFENNKSAGEKRETYGAQTALNSVPYTDEDGLSENFTLYMYDKLDLSSATENQIDTLAEEFPETNLTYVDTLLLKNDTRFQMYKDPREIIGCTIQTQFISNDGKVIFGRWFALRNRLVSENPPTSIKMYYSTTETLGRGDTLKVPSTFLGGSTLTTGNTSTAELWVDVPNKRVILKSTILSDTYTSIVLTDENNYILIGMNRDGNEDRFAFDFVNKRSGVNYKY